MTRRATQFRLFVTRRDGMTILRWRAGDKQLWPVLLTNCQTGRSVQMAAYGTRKEAVETARSLGQYASVGKPVPVPAVQIA